MNNIIQIKVKYLVAAGIIVLLTITFPYIMFPALVLFGLIYTFKRFGLFNSWMINEDGEGRTSGPPSRYE